MARYLAETLARGSRYADDKVTTCCANVLAWEPALWRLVITDARELTNNYAERLLRGTVLRRKNAFGSDSVDDGYRLVERQLTAVQALRLQDRPELTFL